MIKDKCIFLTTPMRSGSSYLSRILSAHRNIDMSYDTVNFFRFCFHKYDPITEKDNLVRLIEDMSFRLENRFEIELNVEDCVKSIKDNEYTYANAYWTILRTIFSDVNKTILGDKESMAWTKIPNFLDMFPNGKAIVLVRDPRDVVSSFKKMTIAPENDYLIALFNVVDAINHAVRYTIRYPDNVYMVCFEKLKLNPDVEVKKLCDFLEIEFSPGMLDYKNYTNHSGEEWDQTKSKSYPEEVDPLAPVGRWRTKIDSSDLYLCEMIAKKQISMIDLPLSGRNFSLEDFEKAMQKIMSSPLLRKAYKRWLETGEGVEQFPLDPTKSTNWEPAGVINPHVFT